MTRERVKDWQYSIIWLVGTLLTIGVLYGSFNARLNALEQNRQDERTLLIEMNKKLDEIRLAMPLLKEHIEKDHLMNPGDLPHNYGK